MARVGRLRYPSPVRPPTPAHLLIALTSLGLVALVGCGRERDLREWTPEDHQPPPSGGAAGDDRTAAAEDPDPEATLFGSRCASCHGADGRGGGPAAPPNVPDFTVASFQADRTDEALARVISEGRGLMPPFGGELTDAGIAAMVRYVRRLGGGALAPSPATEAGPPPEAP